MRKILLLSVLCASLSACDEPAAEAPVDDNVNNSAPQNSKNQVTSKDIYDEKHKDTYSPQLQTWLSAPVGSRMHPVGALTAWARCGFSGVFDDNLTINQLDAPIDLSNATSVDRLERSIEFFNSVADLNDFYGKSINNSLHKTVQFPAVEYTRRMKPERPERQTVPVRGEYERSEDFKRRWDDYRKHEDQLREEKRVGDVYYILASEEARGSSHVPSVMETKYLSYDADGGSFFINGLQNLIRTETYWSYGANGGIFFRSGFETLIRTESYVYTRWDGEKEESKRHEFPFGAEGTAPQLKKVMSSRVPFPIELAPTNHGYLVVVVEGEQYVKPWTAYWYKMKPVSVYIRNICSGEDVLKIHIRE